MPSKPKGGSKSGGKGKAAAAADAKPAARQQKQQEEEEEQEEVFEQGENVLAKDSGELYDAKVKVLGELVDHHVEEEEKEMFPKMKELKLDLQALGEEMAARAAELQ